MKSKSVMLLSFLIVLLFGSQIVSANQTMISILVSDRISMDSVLKTMEITDAVIPIAIRHFPLKISLQSKCGECLAIRYAAN